jgi:hypothetical protein
MNIYKRVEKGFTEYENWRYLRNEKYVSANEFVDITKFQYPSNIEELRCKNLTALLGNYYMVSFPNMNILNYINPNTDRRGIVLSTQDNPYPQYCPRCCGAGKFDWISSVTGPNHFDSRFEFTRDERVVLLYYKSNGKLSKNHIWASTEIYEGERICDSCLGTGINFEVSYYQFPPDLKKRLVLYDIRHLLTK